jgi:hypothetical protein
LKSASKLKILKHTEVDDLTKKLIILKHTEVDDLTKTFAMVPLSDLPDDPFKPGILEKIV